LSLWSSHYCFYCTAQPPTAGTGPNSVGRHVRRYHRDGNERLDPAERDKGNGSCRRRGRSAGNGVDVRKGRKIFRKWVSRRLGHSHRAVIKVVLAECFVETTRLTN